MVAIGTHGVEDRKESGTTRLGPIVARRTLVSPCFLHTNLGMKSLRREKDPVYGVLYFHSGSIVPRRLLK